MESVPEYPYHVTNMLSREALAGRPPSAVSYPVVFYQNRMAESRRMFETLDKLDLRILRVEESLCPGGRCQAGDGINTYYSDSNHLSRYGALTFRAALVPMFESFKR
jgi:hypothetical protein